MPPKVKPGRLVSDMQELRELTHAKAKLDGIDLEKTVPKITWRVDGSAPRTDQAIGRAAVQVIRAQWTRKQFADAVAAVIEAQAAAIKAKYPGIEIEE